MRRAGERRVRRGLGAVSLAITLVAVPVVALAQTGGTVSGLLIRVQGDLALGAEESADLVVVVSGDAAVRGRAGAVVVIGGTARLVDARVGRLVVLRGTAELEGSTRVLGDVWLLSADLQRAPGADVVGAVRHGIGQIGWRWVVGEPVLALGVLGLMLLVGWLAVAVGAATLRRAAAALGDDLPRSLGAALLLFLVGPAAAVLLFFSVLGLPLSVAYLALALPALALVGFPVSSLWLGRRLLGSDSPRPYPAVLLGGVALAALGLIPFAGVVLAAAACALGAGALAVTARSAYEGEPPGPVSTGG